jgi:hypothetical protein
MLLADALRHPGELTGRDHTRAGRHVHLLAVDRESAWIAVATTGPRLTVIDALSSEQLHGDHELPA